MPEREQEAHADHVVAPRALATGAPAPSPGLQAELLRVQRLAGNRATAKLIARLSPARAPLARQEDVGAGDMSMRLGLLASDMEMVLTHAEDRIGSGGDDPDGHLVSLRDAITNIRSAAVSEDTATQRAILSAFSGDRLLSHEATLLSGSRETAEASDPIGSVAGSIQSGDIARVLSRLARDRDATLPVRQATGRMLQRQLAETLTLWGTAVLAADAEASPVEAATGPPGWAVAAGLAVVGAALIGAGILMASAQPETLSQEEQQAVNDRAAGRPYDEAAYRRAKRKIEKNEKFEGERNRRKPRSSG